MNKKTYRVCCCGDREWTDVQTVYDALKKLQESLHGLDIVVVHGAARGADTIASVVAEGLSMRVEAYQADWNRYRRSAGPIRNKQMLDSGLDLVYAFHNDIKNSRGTKNMMSISEKAGVEVVLFTSND